MHAGTIVLATGLALSTIAAIGLILWSALSRYGYISENGFALTLMILANIIGLVSALALLFFLTAQASCDTLANDYNIETTYSWNIGCRTPATVDGETVLIPTHQFRFNEDLQLDRGATP